MRPSWDEYGLTLARAVATRADCSRRRVGAVILDKEHRVVGAGYNGAPSGKIGCLSGGCPRATSGVEPGSPYDNCISIHAEVNALLHSSHRGGGTIYVTDKPCNWCSKVIAGSGLDRVVYLENGVMCDYSLRETGLPSVRGNNDLAN